MNEITRFPGMRWKDGYSVSQRPRTDPSSGLVPLYRKTGPNVLIGSGSVQRFCSCSGICLFANFTTAGQGLDSFNPVIRDHLSYDSWSWSSLNVILQKRLKFICLLSRSL